VRFVFDGEEQALRGLLAELIKEGFPVVSFGQDTGGLEAIFLRVTRRLGEDEPDGGAEATANGQDRTSSGGGAWT